MNRPIDRRRNLDHPHTAKALVRVARRYAKRMDRWHQRWESEQGLHDEPQTGSQADAAPRERTLMEDILEGFAFGDAPITASSRDPETEACLRELDEEYSRDNDRRHIGQAA